VKSFVLPKKLFFLIALFFVNSTVSGQSKPSLEQQLKQVDSAMLATESLRRGDPQRGALVFYMSPAGCIKCHQGGSDSTPLGPDLSAAHTTSSSMPLSDQSIVEALLYPSKSIRKGYETLKLLTASGQVISGMLVRETKYEIVVRDAANLESEIKIRQDEIEDRSTNEKSMMPDGLVATLKSPREFYDLVSYLSAITKGGPDRAKELQPAPEQLVVIDDTGNIAHAKILSSFKENKDMKAGQAIFEGLCSSCHGVDGNTPSLSTARAFGTQKLKFGSDPYSMFMTLSRGNGLMAATTYLSPKERYQVVHYIRERFMMSSNPDYKPVTNEYLSSLPNGTDMGEFKPAGERDYGPALASQLGRELSSALTVKLGDMTVGYNLHTMGQAGIWTGGFLDLDQTQHQRGRGEGYPKPKGKDLPRLAGWKWGHEGTLDYSRENLLARGPLPSKWLDYRGHYLHDDNIVFSYKIDGREVLELPERIDETLAIRRTLRIGAGNSLTLCIIAGSQSTSMIEGIIEKDSSKATKSPASVASSVAITGERKGKDLASFSASKVLGETDEMRWSVDGKHQVVLTIPADTKSRLIEIISFAGDGDEALQQLNRISAGHRDPATLINGASLRWKETLDTVGYPGFEQGAYAFDTLTIPESTPWNTWFRTSALDFFPDGRMAVTTTGGDVWIVSGVDNDLLNLRWKRFAAGMFEPFGVKVVDGQVYVTCRDRLTRLHDFNQDGEADFYESFSADTDVSTFFHAFNFDLHTDAEGNFFYTKCGQYTDYALPGAVIKVSPDGKNRSVVCTGFRTPNGMGMLPDGRMTVSDNQGSWMPASKISLVKEKGFYGYVQTHSSGSWSPDGGRIDAKKVIPPKDFDQPIVWMPQEVDNSSGGQIWVDDKRWGPLSGRLLHTSFGKGWLYYVNMQEVDGVAQAAVVKLPHDFVTGIMRGRVNPIDGQVYVTGVNGWNENGRPGLRDGGIERIRYTGKPFRMITDCKVQPNGLQLTFDFPLDASMASKPSSYDIEQWNYKWAASYGSDMYHPTTGNVGTERVTVASAKISDDLKTIDLIIPSIKPVNQMRVRLNLTDADGKPFTEEIHWTINQVPKAKLTPKE